MLNYNIDYKLYILNFLVFFKFKFRISLKWLEILTYLKLNIYKI